MIRKIMKAVCAICFSVTALAGCQESAPEEAQSETSESILRQMNENMEQVTSMHFTMTMDMTIGMDGTDESMNLKVVMNNTAVTEPLAYYSRMFLYMADKMVGDSVSYGMEEDGKFYMFMQNEDAWVKVPVEMNPLAGATGLSVKEDDSLVLQESTQKVNEKTCYILTGTLSSSEMEDLLSGTSEMSGSLLGNEAMDVQDVTVTYAIDTKTMLPVQLQCDYGELSMQVEETTVRVSPYLITIDFTSFNQDNDFKIPDGVIANAITMEEGSSILN